MKLQLRISNCAFDVPIKPGPIPNARVIRSRRGRARHHVSPKLLSEGGSVRAALGGELAENGAYPGDGLERGINAASTHTLQCIRKSSKAPAVNLLKRPEGRAPNRRAFTLIELLTVVAIIGILAALIAPVFKHFSKSDVNEAATRQMLDDFARARQLAISTRSTIYMVFVPTNFWTSTGWGNLPTTMQQSTVVTQMYGSQWTGYYIESLRTVGDQPGRVDPHDLQKVRNLPDGSFIAPFKFSSLPYPNAPLVVQSTYPVYGFLTSSNIPFPTADVLTNSNPPSSYPTVPYIAFNYLGQLTPGDGSLLPYDEFVPLAYGSLMPSKDPNSKAYVKGLPNATEAPAGNSTNISYNLIHIDRITGRARVERQDVL